MMNDVRGVSNVLRHFLPSMIKRGSGTIVNVTHVIDPPSGSQMSPYRASRSAITSLTSCLAEELPMDMIAVELDPGTIRGLDSDAVDADTGPLHKIHGDEMAHTWAKAAVPFILCLTPEVSGCTLHVPGYS